MRFQCDLSVVVVYYLRAATPSIIQSCIFVMRVWPKVTMSTITLHCIALYCIVLHFYLIEVVVILAKNMFNHSMSHLHVLRPKLHWGGSAKTPSAGTDWVSLKWHCNRHLHAHSNLIKWKYYTQINFRTFHFWIFIKQT